MVVGTPFQELADELQKIINASGVPIGINYPRKWESAGVYSRVNVAAGPVPAGKYKHAAWLFFVAFDVCPTNGTKAGDCRLALNETGSKMYVRPLGGNWGSGANTGVDHKQLVEKATDWTIKPVAKPNACTHKLIYADAPTAIVELGAFSMITYIRQEIEVQDASAGNKPVSTFKHAIKLEVDANGVVTAGETWFGMPNRP